MLSSGPFHNRGQEEAALGEGLPGAEEEAWEQAGCRALAESWRRYRKSEQWV